MTFSLSPLSQPLLPIPSLHTEEFIRGFAVFDKDQTGYIGVGELRYVLTSLGEKLSDQEVDELLAGVKVGNDGSIDYKAFVREVRQYVVLDSLMQVLIIGIHSQIMAA